MSLCHLIYTSFSVGIPSEQELEELLVQSRERNLRQNVTGMLLYRCHTYMQVLEGEEEDVDDIFRSIQRDPRNTHVTKLLKENIPHRDFPNWSMGFKRIKDDEPIEGLVNILSEDFDAEELKKSRNLAVKLILSFSDHQ